MQKYILYIIGGIAAILIVVWLLSYRQDFTDSAKYKELQKEIRIREDSILVLNKMVELKESEIKKYVEIRDSSLLIIQQLESNLSTKKQIYEKAILALDTLTVSELQEYFSSRYPR